MNDDLKDAQAQFVSCDTPVDMPTEALCYKHYRTLGNTAIYVSECGGIMTINPSGGRHFPKMKTLVCPAMRAKYTLKYPEIGILVRPKRYAFYVHRLVAEVYLHPKNLFEVEVDHLDGNIMNFHVLNLEWVTHEENIRRAVEARKRKKAEKINNCANAPQKGGVSK